MLTDEERNEILDTYMNDDGCSIHDMCKAIERAVLAKAEEQEPVGKICKSAECGGVDFYFDKIPDGETMLYAHPLPAQAQAIPEGYEISEIDHPSRSGYVIRTKTSSYCVWDDKEPSVYKFLASLSASQNPNQK